VFATDALEEVLPQQVGAQFVERPTPQGQAKFVRGCLGQPPDGGDLGWGKAWRSTVAAGLANRIQPLPLEGAEIGVGGMGMDFQDASDVAGRNPSEVEQKGFGAAALPSLERLFEQAVELATFGEAQLADRQGTWHGGTSDEEGVPSFYQALGDKLDQTLCDTTVNPFMAQELWLKPVPFPSRSG
jgi:hypothetical protein